MKLIRDNDISKIFEMDEDEILQQFANSEICKDKTRGEKIRLALFIAYDEPNGLQSTFYGHQFEKLWDNWCANKHKFIGVTNVS